MNGLADSTVFRRLRWFAPATTIFALSLLTLLLWGLVFQTWEPSGPVRVVFGVLTFPALMARTITFYMFPQPGPEQVLLPAARWVLTAAPFVTVDAILNGARWLADRLYGPSRG